MWDKRAVRTLAPFAYFHSHTALVGLAFAALLARRHRPAALGAAWRRHRPAVVQVAAGNAGTYVLVLFAIRGETSSYVVGLRRLSVVAGVLLGWRLLGEPVGPAKRLGVAAISAGCVLVALA